MLETRLRNTSSTAGGDSQPSSTVNAQSSLIIVKHDDGSEEYFNPTADTDAARGAALESAFSGHISRDTILLGPGVYTVTTSLTLLNSASLIGIGMPTIQDTTLTEPLLRIINNDIIVENLNIKPSASGLGVFSATSQTVARAVFRNLFITANSSSASGAMWSQSIGGGTTEHNIQAKFYNCFLEGGSLSGFGAFAYLNSSGSIEMWDCDIFGVTNGILFSNSGNSYIYGGNYESTLDAMTSGISHSMYIVGAKARGGQADLYADDGSVTALWCDVRENTVVGNNIQYITSTVVGNLNIVGSLKVDSIENDTGLSSGRYNVVLTNSSNIDSVTATSAQFLRIGNTVTVSGMVTVDPAITATSTFFSMSLPIASSFNAIDLCSGTAFARRIAGQGAAVLAETGNSVARMQWIAGDITAQPMNYTYTYRII